MRCVSLCFWCCCILVLVVGQLKPIRQDSEEEIQIIIAIISELDTFILIKNFITYVGNEYDTSAMGASLQQHLMKNFDHPMIVAGADIGLLHQLTNYQNLAVIYFSGIDDPKLTIVLETMSRLTAMISIFVYRPNENEVTSIFKEAFLHWCFNKSFYNVILILRNNNEYEIWSYETKLSFQILQFSIKSLGQAIEQKFCKLKFNGQFKPLVAVFQSLPDAFVYNSSKTISGNLSLSGQAGLLFVSFIRYIKGAMEILPLSYEDYVNKIPDACTKDRCIDIGVNLMPNYVAFPQGPSLAVSQTCLLLPSDVRTPLEAYPISYDRYFTLIIFMVFIFIANTAIKRISNPRMPLGALLFGSLKLLLGHTIPNRAFRRLGLSEKFIEIFTLIYTLLTSSLVVSYLTSALTTGLRRPQIVDAETFLASGLRIMVSPQQLENFFDYMPHSLSNRLLIVDQSVRDQHVYSLNNSFAYVTQTHKWLILDFLQRRLRQPKLRLSPQALCGVRRFMTIYVRFGLCFSRTLENFVAQSKETGLAYMWMGLGLRHAEQAGLLSSAPYNPIIRTPLALKFYFNVFLMHGIGLFLGLMCLLLECLYTYWKNRVIAIVP